MAEVPLRQCPWLSTISLGNSCMRDELITACCAWLADEFTPQRLAIQKKKLNFFLPYIIFFRIIAPPPRKKKKFAYPTPPPAKKFLASPLQECTYEDSSLAGKFLALPLQECTYEDSPKRNSLFANA